MPDEETNEETPQLPRMVITQTRGNVTNPEARAQLEKRAAAHGWTDLEWETLEGGNGEPIDRLSGCKPPPKPRPQKSPADNGTGATIVS